MRTVRYHPEARAEFLQEVQYYAALSPGLAGRYDRAVRAAEVSAAMTPETWPKYKYKTRRVVERRFKFSLVYLHTDSEVYVVAVAPTNRKPGYWRTRLTDEEYLKDLRKTSAESVEYFRASNKPEREVWVVREFLTNLDLAFLEAEIRPSADEPPDVVFRDANFEVKEMLSPGRRRHDEYKERLEKARKATSLSDLLEPYASKSIEVLDVCTSVYAEAKKLAEVKYSSPTRQGLDLLFYVNLTDVPGLRETPFPDLSHIDTLGFRSVSFLMGHRSCTLSAKADAPSFLHGALKRVVHRKIQ